MTPTDFQLLVERMRVAQKSYFRRRTPEALQSSKRLEREVDEVIKELCNKTGRLFEEKEE